MKPKLKQLHASGAANGQVATFDGTHWTPGNPYTDEQVRDVIAAALVAGTGMTVIPDDAGDTITLASTGGYTDEQARDAVGAALVAGPNVTIVVNDAGDTITIASSGGGGGTPGAWTAPALLNGWTNYGSDGGGNYSPAGYYLGPEGVVHLRGLLVAPDSGGSKVSDTTLFALPVGIRPADNIHLLGGVWSSSATPGMRITVYSDTASSSGSGATAYGPGKVKITYPGSTIPTGTIISLDGLSYRPD